MRYMVIVKMREDVGPAPEALQQAMSQEMAQAFESGVMVDAGGLAPSALGTELRVHGGQLSATDGPFAEAKEVVGGYSIVQAESLEQAAALARRVAELHQQHWPDWAGAIEVRPITG